jgi:isopenicillin N synthase-like dioxygenase
MGDKKGDSILPIIDISPWLDDNAQHGRPSVAAALHAACSTYGFFYLKVTSYIDFEETDELVRLARTFFEQSQVKKDEIGLINEDGARGACLR